MANIYMANIEFHFFITFGSGPDHKSLNIWSDDMIRVLGKSYSLIYPTKLVQQNKLTKLTKQKPPGNKQTNKPT